MDLAEQMNMRGRGRLRVVAALVATALMAPVAGVSATSSGPSSQFPCTQTNCVFVLDKDRFKTIVAPGDPQDSLVGINNRGQIAGSYVEDDAEGFHGYFRDRRGRFTTIDVSRRGRDIVVRPQRSPPDRGDLQRDKSAPAGRE